MENGKQRNKIKVPAEPVAFHKGIIRFSYIRNCFDEIEVVLLFRNYTLPRFLSFIQLRSTRNPCQKEFF